MFLDSNVFINYYVSHGKDGQACAALMRRINSGEQKAVISALVVDEVLYILMREKGLAFAQRALQAILMNQNIGILPVDSKALFRLADFLEQGLKPRDALHAATMKANEIETICTYDKAFDKVKGIRRQTPR